NAANTHLMHGGGVAGAIARAGGPAVQSESGERSPIGLGECVETTAGDIPARWVIHAATMEPGGPTSAEILRRATASTPRRGDAGAGRAGLAEAHEPFDGVRVALEHRLDLAFGPVVDPPRDAVRARPLPRGVPKEDPLHPAVDDDAAANHARIVLAGRGVSPRRRA